MKEKESLGFRIFWFSILMLPKLGIFFILLLPVKLDMYVQFLISFFMAILFTKLEEDKQELQNEIFELKQIIENKLND